MPLLDLRAYGPALLLTLACVTVSTTVDAQQRANTDTTRRTAPRTAPRTARDSATQLGTMQISGRRDNLVGSRPAPRRAVSDVSISVSGRCCAKGSCSKLFRA